MQGDARGRMGIVPIAKRRAQEEVEQKRLPEEIEEKFDQNINFGALDCVFFCVVCSLSFA